MLGKIRLIAYAALLVPFLAQGQTGRDQSQAIPADIGQYDIPQVASRYYSVQEIEAFIRNTEQYQAAVRMDMNVVVHYRYYVVGSDQGLFYRHVYEKRLRESSGLADFWNFTVEATFAQNGNLLSRLEITNDRFAPSAEIVSKERQRLQEVRLEEERLNRIYLSAKKELDLARAELNKTLLFPIPLETYTSFILDGSDSITAKDSVSRYMYLELAKEHLKTTLSLLLPTQKFTIGLTDDPPKLFNRGEPLKATPQNIALAHQWIDSIRPSASSDENFDQVLAAIMRTAPIRPDRIIIFTDGGLDMVPKCNRLIPQAFLQKLTGAKTIVDIAPMPTIDLTQLKEAGFKSKDPNQNFIPEVTQKTGGTLLSEIHDMPNADQVRQYKELITKVIEAKTSEK